MGGDVTNGLPVFCEISLKLCEDDAVIDDLHGPCGQGGVLMVSVPSLWPPGRRSHQHVDVDVVLVTWREMLHIATTDGTSSQRARSCMYSSYVCARPCICADRGPLSTDRAQESQIIRVRKLVGAS